MSDYCIFIISHGRPDKIITYDTIRRRGYTGPIYFILDNLDNTRSKYEEKFGAEKIYIFDKPEIAKTTDCGDNFNDLRTTTHARNAAFEIARRLNYKYFIVLDDDYSSFDFRFNKNFDYVTRKLINLDRVLNAMVDFYKSTSQILCLAISQGGDFIGGAEGTNAEKIKLLRKCMNLFICSTDRPFKFFSRLNEDVNTYVNLGMRGNLFFTANQISLVQLQTQSNAGGMTDAYLKYGTYVKSFYTVMYQPSSVKVSVLKTHASSRIHHNISWKKTVPMILRENLRKK